MREFDYENVEELETMETSGITLELMNIVDPDQSLFDHDQYMLLYGEGSQQWCRVVNLDYGEYKKLQNKIKKETPQAV